MSEKNHTKSKSKKFSRNPLFWVTALLVLYMFIGFIVIPFIIRGQAIDFIKEEYNRDAKIENVAFNPFTFALSIQGFLFNEKDRGVFLKWGDFYVDLNLFPLFSKVIDIEELQILYPEIEIVKKREEFNFSDLLVKEEEEVDSLKENSDWDFLIRNLRIKKLNALIQDKSVEPMAEVHIDSIDVLLTNIHPFTSDTTEFKVNFEIREGGKGSINGIYTQIPSMTEFTFDMDSIAIIEAQPYLLSKFAYLRIDSGAINTKGNVKLLMPENEEPTASYVETIGLNDLNMFDTKKEEKFLAWDKLENRSVEIHSEPITLTIDSVMIDGLFSRIAIAEDQTINIIDAFEPVMKNADTTTAEEKEKFDSLFTASLKETSGEENITTISADQKLRREVLESLYREAYSDSLLNIQISQHIKGSDSKDDSIKITAKNINNDQIIDIRDYFNALIDDITIKQKVTENELLKLASDRAERISDFLIRVC